MLGGASSRVPFAGRAADVPWWTNGDRMGSIPTLPSDGSLDALLAAAAPGEPLSGELLRQLRPSGVMGALAQMPLTEILQNMDFGKRSVRVDVWQDGAEGVVQVHDGQIVHALARTVGGQTQGEAAVLELCRRPEGVFRIHYAREETERNVHRPTTFVLLEALRVLDEASMRGGGETPAPLDLGPDPWESPSAAFLADRLGAQDGAGGVGGADGTGRAGEEQDEAVDIEVEADGDAAPVNARIDHPRFRVASLINVFVGDVVTSLHLEDISRGGAFLRTESPPARGSVVTLSLRAPDSADGPIQVPARVVHVLDRAAATSLSREPGIGVQFEELAADVAVRLGAFIDRLAGDPANHAAPGGAATSSDSRERLLALAAESELLVAAGDLESAKRVLSQAQGLAVKDDDVRRKLLNVNESIDAAQANAFLERAMRGGPQAVELARRATQLRPVRDVLLRSLAVFARGGAHDEVADVADQLLELDPDDEGALRTLLDANVAMQRWPVAVSAAESLLRLRPHDEQLRATLQEVLAQARRAP